MGVWKEGEQKDKGEDGELDLGRHLEDREGEFT